jgi:hypothetical protein
VVRESPYRKFVEEIKELNLLYSSTSTSNFESDWIDVSRYRKIIIIVSTDGSCEIQLIFSNSNSLDYFESFTVAYGKYELESNVYAKNLKIKVIHGTTPSNFNLIVYTL